MRRGTDLHFSPFSSPLFLFRNSLTTGLREERRRNGNSKVGEDLFSFQLRRRETALSRTFLLREKKEEEAGDDNFSNYFFSLPLPSFSFFASLSPSNLSTFRLLIKWGRERERRKKGELEAKISPLFAKAVAKTKLQKGQGEAY